MEYMTLKTESTTEFIENRSRFIGRAKPISCEQEAINYIATLRSKHWDATHNVYAYSLREGGICRYSDDGEPSGTAGTPVLSVLTKGGITDAVVVVTRYFGGILLGAGGLVRAYSHSASLAVNAAQPIIMRMCEQYSVVCDYSDYGRVAAIIPECGGVIDSSDFTDVVRIEMHIEPSLVGHLSVRLADATCGRTGLEILGSDFYEFAHTDK